MLSKPKFRPGKALSNTELWQQDLNLLKRHHYPVPQFAENMIQNGLASIKHKQIYNQSKRKVEFNNETFENITALENKYKAKEDCNYNGARQNEDILRNLIKDYEDIGIVREVRSQELDSVVINPVNRKLKKG